MGSKFHGLRWGCFFLIFFFVASCSFKHGIIRPEREDEFLQEISRLEKLSREHPDISVRTESHLQLAFLYVNYRNPQLDYTRALQEMESYLSLSLNEEQSDNFRDWLAVLRKMNDLRKDRMEIGKKNQDLQTHIEKLQASLERVQKTNSNMRGEVASLKEMNKKMTEAIERLKSLDLQMEEKRSLTK